jgi:hypothetical protein
VRCVGLSELVLALAFVRFVFFSQAAVFMSLLSGRGPRETHFTSAQIPAPRCTHILNTLLYSKYLVLAIC